MKAFLACCLLLVAVYQTGASHQRPIRDLLSECSCYKDYNQSCRIIQPCGANEPFEAKCVSCVPQGMDQLCRANGFYKTVLLGNAYDPGSITPKGCVVAKGLCPAESVCVAIPKAHDGLGICCHNPMPEPDKQCAGNCNKWDECHCKMGEECDLNLLKCGKYTKTCRKTVVEEVEPVAF